VLRANSNSMAVSRDARVLVPRVVIARRLALEHLAVLRDTVALALGHGVLAVHGLTLCRGPREVVATHLNVVVCKLAELVVVHAEKLSLFGGTQLEAGDLVDDEGEDGADSEGVDGDGDDVGDLLVDGRGGAGDGASCDSVVDAVEANDVVGGKDAVEEESNHSGDSVLSEDIERIVNLDPELDCGNISMVIREFTW
jgi:hypothetical protein